jgi:hypothetical protein
MEVTIPEKKAPTLWPRRPQIFPNEDEERLARDLDALEKENRWIDNFIERVGRAVKDIIRKK